MLLLLSHIITYNKKVILLPKCIQIYAFYIKYTIITIVYNYILTPRVENVWVVEMVEGSGEEISSLNGNVPIPPPPPPPKFFTLDKKKQFSKSEHQSILVVLKNSFYHIKENLPKKEVFLPLFTALARTLQFTACAFVWNEK